MSPGVFPYPMPGLGLDAFESELEDKDHDDFTPQLLNDVIWEAQQGAKSVFDWLERAGPESTVDPTEFIIASPSERNGVERHRLYNMQLMSETILDKYQNALKTQALLRKIEAGKTGFVLFLRGFSLQEHHFRTVTMGTDRDIGEYGFRFELARKIAPAPLIVVRNPAISEILLAQFAGSKGAAENTYVLDLDSNWEAEISNWVSAASFICMRNELTSPGLLAEIGIIQKLGRLNDTYFTHPDTAHALVPDGPVQAFDETAASHIRASTEQSVRPLLHHPNATSLWAREPSRGRGRDSAFYVFDLFNFWAAHGQSMPRDIQTRLMFAALAASIGLERPDFMVMTLGSYGGILSQYRPDELPQQDYLVDVYRTRAQSLASAIHDTGTTILNYQDLNTLKTLMRSEKPEELVQCAMQCFARLLPQS